MTIIPHRPLRNEGRKILERVKSGEIIDMTIKGKVAAMLIPPPSSPFERLLLRGAVRPAASTGPVDFTLLARTRLD
ncbi:type II toxin-antitoxin system Phd/YefM family antitoxin [Arthrobacter crystallopoietes]|uniref:type II toxin-antitoxin system Phd/YefM family antitoxin n=1 Tax=Crystallibacter crystallopoietes TaxID=37928 RepID=UPI001ABDAE96|nr:prevent-host-death protein antitoxin of TAS system [Arthrobacter crystallopoietes]QTG82542.1 prevent-host-death protein antitoxin of TAS system [Arthrobacter crystallopoietes]